MKLKTSYLHVINRMRSNPHKSQQYAWRHRSKNCAAALLTRREFGGLCLALSSFASSSGPSLVNAAPAASPGPSVKFPDGTVVPAVGQGSWHIGQGRHPATEEEDALRTGLSLGMTLIDTSGNYSDGHSEELIGR